MSTADTYGFWLGSFFHSEKLPAFALLAGMILTFLGLRINTRLIRKGVTWWPGNIHRGKVHVHHVIFGLPVMFVVGVVEFTVQPVSPWVELLALMFGGAASAVLDEFALVLHLKDVYWEREGHQSIVAVFMGTSFIALMAIGMIPLGYSDPFSGGALIEWAAVGVMLLNAAFVSVTFLKGKMWTGMIGLFIPIFAAVGAFRLGRPRSVYARSRYKDKPQKIARAERRSHEFDQQWGHWQQHVLAFVSGIAMEKKDDAPHVMTAATRGAPARVPAVTVLPPDSDETAA